MSRTLDDIADTLGLQVAVRISRSFGGRTLGVPNEVTEIHPISGVVGFEAARVIVREYAGMAIDVPCERTALLAMRDRSIVEAKKGGASIHELSRSHHLSRRMIRKILAKAGLVPVPPSDAPTR